MRVLIACEFSATVRDAFRARGHDAWSCDLLPCEGDPAWHVQGDALAAAHGQQWDLMIAHPPCTHLAVSGAAHFARKIASGEQQAALDFVRLLLDAPIPRIALENPVSIISSKIRKPDQMVQPYDFGHDASKRTCLWLKELPPLRPTQYVAPRTVVTPTGRIAQRWANQCDNYGHDNKSPSPDRWKLRSATFQGIADAMAEQWGNL
tara:strand:- start:3976 stop:4593 length:618 start_codon:yes stop_codon:yes gene_type:complete